MNYRVDVYFCEQDFKTQVDSEDILLDSVSEPYPNICRE